MANNALPNTGGTITGSLTVNQDVTVRGNLSVFGNSTTIYTSSLDLTDSLIYLANNNFTSDLVDIGFIGHYNDTGNAHTGIIRDPTLKEYIFFEGYTPEVESNNLINIAHPSFAYSNVNAKTFKGNLIANRVSVNGNLSIAGSLDVVTPIGINYGGTGANTAAGAQTNLLGYTNTAGNGIATTAAIGTGSTANSSSSNIAGTVLTIGGTVTGTFSTGMAIYGTGVLPGTVITGGGGTTFSVNIPQTVSTTAINGGGFATISFATQASAPYANGSYISVQGVTPTGYNGYYQVTNCTTANVTYASGTTGAQTISGFVAAVIPLTNTSTTYQYTTGTGTVAFSLPDTSTLQRGWSFRINNAASNGTYIYSSAGVVLFTIASGMTGYFTCIDTTVNTAAGWRVGVTEISGYTGGGSMVLATSPTFSGINATGGINLSGSTTNAINLGTGITTPTITIGSTTGTGRILVGTTTGSQPIQIGMGAITANTIATTANGTISTTTFTVNPANTGTFSVGMALTGTGVLPGTYITGVGTGTGGIGTYTINQTQTISSNTAITGTTQKSIDIGPNGISGSITNITLGSSVAGSTSNTNVNGTFRVGTNLANYTQLVGSATSFSPVISAQGTDASISQVFQSKGTGAIDLAAGSSGVNISNGNTVTALTATNSGSAYTSVPSIAITAPTTAGGVQAAATVAMTHLSASTISNGGTGYSLNDTLTIVGGTTGSAATFTVTSVSGGVVTGITRLNTSTYTVLPSSPSATTVSPAGGTGCTIAVNWAINGSAFTIGTAGSGYVEQPTVSFSGGGGSGAAAYATVGSGTIVKSIGSTMDFVTPSGYVGFRVTDVSSSSAVGYWTAYGGLTQPQLRAIGSGAGVIITQSAVPIIFQTAATEQFRVAHTASAVNYVQVTGSANGANPTISAQGSDPSIGLIYNTKSGNTHQFQIAGTTRLKINADGSNDVGISSSGGLGFKVLATASQVNYISTTGTISGANNVALIANGTDTDIDLTLTPKGAGRVNIGNANIVQSGVSKNTIIVRNQAKGTLANLDNISVSVNTSGFPLVSTISSTQPVFWSWERLGGGLTGGSYTGSTLTTTAIPIGINAGLSSGGDTAIINLYEQSGNNFYRITCTQMVTAGNASIIIERIA